MKRITLCFVVVFLAANALLFADDHIFSLPVEGNDLQITSAWFYPDEPPFNGGLHQGIDYVSSSGPGFIGGRDIYAAYGGVVEDVVSIVTEGGLNPSLGYGNYVRVNHQNGYVSLYGHMTCGSATVNEGDIVIQGQVIGTVGNTGYSSGYHLHFQIWKNEDPVDPYGWYTYPGAPNTYPNCNPSEYYWTETPPIHAPSSSVSERVIPDDIIMHVIGTPNYYWLKDGLMCRFDSEYPFYTWGWQWGEALEFTQEEFSHFQLGGNVPVKVGTCVYDGNYERWVFDFASFTSSAIVKRRATAWGELGYSGDVWIPVSNSFMNGFNEGEPLTSGSQYPFGTVLCSASNPSQRYVLVKGDSYGAPNQKIKLPIFSSDAYNINYYHFNFNIQVSDAILNSFPTASNGACEKIMDGKLIRGSDNHIFYIENGLKRHILDATTFSYYGFNYANVRNVSDNDINSFPTGEQISFSVGGGEVSFDGGELEDGGFDSGLTSYWRFGDTQEVGVFSVSSGNSVSGCFKAETQVNSAVNYYDVELKQLVNVESQGLYHLSFWAKSESENLPFKLEMIKDTSPWNNYGLWKEVVATSVWKKKQYLFECLETDPLARLTIEVGEHPGHLYFDKIVFEKVDDVLLDQNSLLANGNFELGHYAPWTAEDHLSCAEYYVDETNAHNGQSAFFVDPNCASDHYNVQLRQNIAVQNGCEYFVSFWAKAQSQRTVKLEVYNDGAPWNNYGLWSEVQVGTSWQRYDLQFVASQSGSPRFAMYFGHQDVPVWIDDIVISTSVANGDDAQEVCDDFLLCNYPNPFNPETTIMFSPMKTSAKLVIYNIKGQIVKSFDVERGERSVIWRGANDAGVGVGSGVYFYTIKAMGKNMNVKKMIYLK